ncbi:MAG: hypothetical protein U9N55_04340 [candidate division Zixibacteria bacterium]|nr:hypothetical protein [candidate division Zixibacteria bacterium]
MQRISVFVLILLLFLGLAGNTLSQEVNCDFDRQYPSVENARDAVNLRSDWLCAQAELQYILDFTKPSPSVQADAHILLGIVYFNIQPDSASRYKLAKQEFEEAFKAYPDWNGKLDPSGPELEALLIEIKDDDSLRVSSKGKRWYQKRWVQIVGAALVVGTVAAILIGGDGDGPKEEPMPDFPSPPEGSQ